VARLIADGLSNRDIGSALVITESTAERHVANILRKLGARSRAQVGAWVGGQART
jgi:DNA-binding NarL/FixJ family response regulator